MWINIETGEVSFQDDCEIVRVGTICDGLIMGWHLRRKP
jgi:hypothetical protein